jgi:hypothetical protein
VLPSSPPAASSRFRTWDTIERDLCLHQSSGRLISYPRFWGCLTHDGRCWHTPGARSG